MAAPAPMREGQGQGTRNGGSGRRQGGKLCAAISSARSLTALYQPRCWGQTILSTCGAPSPHPTLKPAPITLDSPSTHPDTSLHRLVLQQAQGRPTNEPPCPRPQPT